MWLEALWEEQLLVFGRNLTYLCALEGDDGGTCSSHQVFLPLGAVELALRGYGGSLKKEPTEEGRAKCLLMLCEKRRTRQELRGVAGPTTSVMRVSILLEGSAGQEIAL